MPDKKPDSAEAAYATEHFDSIAEDIKRHERAYRTYVESVQASGEYVAMLSPQEYIKIAVMADKMELIAQTVQNISFKLGR